ncbi:hypothetical protein [Streptomyces sedi]|uniref:Uncharacterized protein n=1 Tax=Streptomyces sedi TaxID=555059 RepID=A0A5C4VF97_9ACTN|nr:hypothetical protein [Streptomyces sedi]TNM34501.1 hypothetical protein FH715_02190 [Streptomyces sedi]
MHEMRAEVNAQGHRNWHVTPKASLVALCGKDMTSPDGGPRPELCEGVVHEGHCGDCVQGFEQFVTARL